MATVNAVANRKNNVTININLLWFSKSKYSKTGDNNFISFNLEGFVRIIKKGITDDKEINSANPQISIKKSSLITFIFLFRFKLLHKKFTTEI